MLSSRTWRLVAVVPVAGALWWVVGFLPWLLEGLGPVPPLGLEPAPLTERTRLALPLVGSALHHLVLGGIVGGVSGAAAAFLGRDRRVVAVGASFLGVALALTITLVQSVSGLDAVDHRYASDSRALVGLAVVTVLATIAGWLLGTFAVFGTVGVGVALAAAAGAATQWIPSVVAATRDQPVEYVDTFTTGARWVAAGLLAAALVATAARRPALVLAWPGLLALAWVTSPVVTAAGYAQGYLRPGLGEPDLGEAVAASWHVFWAAVRPEHRDLTPWIVAVVVAALVIVALHTLAPRLRPRGPDERTA